MLELAGHERRVGDEQYRAALPLINISNEVDDRLGAVLVKSPRRLVRENPLRLFLFATSARAIAMRCFSPPLSSFAVLGWNPSSPTLTSMESITPRCSCLGT